ncbi:MAG: hypothetical protein ACRDUW_10900 [Pseudonocardiaceae bacterium]
MGGFLGSVWGWIKGAGSGIESAIQTFVGNVVSALHDVIFGFFGVLGNAWGFLAQGFSDAFGWAESFANEVTYVLEQVWKVYLPEAFRGVAAAANALYRFSGQVVGWVEAVYKWAEHLVSNSINSLWQLVIRDIWTPLRNSLDSAWTTLSDVYNTVAGWIQAPASLVALLFTPALRWLAALSDAALETVAEWVLRIFLRSITRIVTIVEKVLSDVL